AVATAEKNIIETALTAGNFGTLAAALTAADLVEPLQGKGPFTVFAPTDAAFAALPKGTLESLLEKKNKDTLTTILTYHVVPGKVAAADVVKLRSATSLNGQTLDIRVDDAGVRVAGVQVVITDIECSNGIIHVIDAVMMPATETIVETAIAAGNFTTLAAALGAADLVDTLQGAGPFTVFAPTDDAFAALPKGTVESLLLPENRAALTSILTYHVVSGRVPAADVVNMSSAAALNGQRLGIRVDKSGVTIGGAKVVVTDIQCKNGTIHVIDTVMLPSSKNIVETAVEAGTFQTLAAALGAGGLVEVLQGEGPFTVFAPTDDAFAALPAGTVESLLLPENRDQLIAILKYHVVAGRVYSDQLANGKVATLQGSKVTVALKKAGAFLNESRVTAADIETSNGVIHVIDKVLLPQ
ncbi:MAG: fasciclin domain-containing protein, partial [Planctomycetes bacterium]|nr:fasciclin domain-containing protein [Planctomycetota bacterium]